MIPVLCPYRPVRREARKAVHCGVAEIAFWNSNPSAARRSRFGVLTTPLPMQAIAEDLIWSAHKITILGDPAPCRDRNTRTKTVENAENRAAQVRKAKMLSPLQGLPLRVPKESPNACANHLCGLRQDNRMKRTRGAVKEHLCGLTALTEPERAAATRHSFMANKYPAPPSLLLELVSEAEESSQHNRASDPLISFLDAQPRTLGCVVPHIISHVLNGKSLFEPVVAGLHLFTAGRPVKNGFCNKTLIVEEFRAGVSSVGTVVSSMDDSAVLVRKAAGRTHR